MNTINIKCAIVFAIIIKFVLSQQSDDLFSRLFQNSLRNENRGLNCEGCNAMYNCGCNNECQGYYGNDYNDILPNSNVEIVYVAPEQYNNIFEFIMKRMKTTHATIPTKTDENTESITTIRPYEITSTMRKEESEETIRPFKPVDPTTFEQPDTDPVENVRDDNFPTNVKDTTTTEKKTAEIIENEEESEYEDERDSVEDMNETKKSKDNLKIPVDENDSKPQNIDSWLNF